MALRPLILQRELRWDRSPPTGATARQRELVDVAEQHGDADELHAFFELAGDRPASRPGAGRTPPSPELSVAERLLLAFGQREDIGPLEFRRCR